MESKQAAVQKTPGRIDNAKSDQGHRLRPSAKHTSSTRLRRLQLLRELEQARARVNATLARAEAVRARTDDERKRMAAERQALAEERRRLEEDSREQRAAEIDQIVALSEYMQRVKRRGPLRRSSRRLPVRSEPSPLATGGVSLLLPGGGHFYRGLPDLGFFWLLVTLAGLGAGSFWFGATLGGVVAVGLWLTASCDALLGITRAPRRTTRRPSGRIGSRRRAR